MIHLHYAVRGCGFIIRNSARRCGLLLTNKEKTKMKNLFYIVTLALFANFAFANPPLTQHIIKYSIVVPAHDSFGLLYIPLPDKIEAIKICVVDETAIQKIQFKATIDDVYTESVSRDCSALEDISRLQLPENPELRVGCRNFDSVERTCKAKIIYYTKPGEPVEPSE